MNGVIEYKDVKFKMTSKGVWYCDGLTIQGKEDADIISEADVTMMAIRDLLKEHNAEEITSKDKP